MSRPEQTSRSTRPVGRPPVAAQRREQIFDAVEQCVLELGLARTTLEAIADRAGMTRSAIAYFVGNRDDVIDTAVARSVQRFVATMRSTIETAPPREQLERFVDYVLASDKRRAGLITIIDALIAHAHHDEHAREQLRTAYIDLQRFIEQITAHRFPEAAPADRAAVATGLILLLREFDRVRSLGATDTPLEQRRQARHSADVLIKSLAE